MNAMDNSVESMLNRRLSLLRAGNKTVPVYHEAEENLGIFLSKTVLREMSPMAKEMMSIDKPLPVAPKTVWLSPADRIDGNLILKPPPNQDVIKALTHEGILEIGSTVEEKLEKHWQARIKAAKKEVEDFERFECNNRIKFALQQEQILHEAALKQQRLDLLKMFQKDRDELIEESRTELKTLEKKLVNEYTIKTDRDVRMSVEEIQRSANQKINELNQRIDSLESDLQEMQGMMVVEVEKRKNQDWQILHEIFIEIHKQFTSKLTTLHNQHNAELRQLYLEVKTQIVDSEQTTDYNDDTWEDGSLCSELEQEKIEFSDVGKPFVINLGKVEGESPEDKSPKEDDHSTGSSFKCYKHRSKPKSDDMYADQGPFTSHILYTDSQTEVVDLNDINTTDVSCNILRRLGLNFNVANIEKVKVELDNLLLNVNKRGETKLLTVTDSLDLLVCGAANVDIPESRELIPKMEPEDADREEYKRIMNRKKSKKLNETKLAIPLTVDEYMKTLIPSPKYMASARANISIWDYKAMNDEEWNNLLQELDDKLQPESNENNLKSKTVTVTSPNSMESLAASGKIVSKKPSHGILRPSVEKKFDEKTLLQNEIFQTDQMQCLVKKLCNE